MLPPRALYGELMSTLLRIQRTARLTGAAYLAVSQAILVGLGYVTHVLIGKIGGPPLYGKYGIVLSIMSILNMFLTLGIPVAASKETAEDEENSGGVFLSALRLQLVFALALAALAVSAAPLVAHLLGDSGLVPLIRFTAVIYPLQAIYALLSNYFNGLHAFAAQARLTVLYATAKLAGSVGFLLVFRSVPAALSGFLVGALAACGIGLPRALPTLRGRIKRAIPPRRLFVFAGTFVGMTVALQLLMSVDLFLVKRILRDDTLVGYYNAAATVARIPYFILQGLGFVFLPSVARLLKEDPDRARTFMREVFRYLFLLLLPISALTATTSKALLSLFFSAAYHPAARPLTFLAFALVFLSAFYLLSTIAAGAGRHKVPLVLSWSLVPLAIGLGFLLIPRYHLSGAALTTVSVAALGTFVLGAFMYRRFRLTFPLATLVRGAAGTAVAILPTYFASPPTFFLPVWYLLLFLVYGLVLFALGEIRTEDWQYLKRLLPGTAGAEKQASAP